MLTIRPATIADIPVIQDLTRIIWPATYSPILSNEQIDYMLEMMYGSEALRNQMNQLQHRFLICYDNDTPVGFASYGTTGQDVYKLHKLYVLPNQQGKGIGKFIVGHVEKEISSNDAVALDLNVNRHNPAKTFYEKLGFVVIREEDIDIGNGYWMNDYVMRKRLVADR